MRLRIAVITVLITGGGWFIGRLSCLLRRGAWRLRIRLCGFRVRCWRVEASAGVSSGCSGFEGFKSAVS
jgi:hypothetical protein